MGVRRPKIPKTPLPKGAKKVKAAAPADIVQELPTAKRAKHYSQTQAPNTRGIDYNTANPAIPVLRRRGGRFAYTPEGEETWIGADGRIPQIDPTPSSNPPRPRTLRAGYLKDRGEPTGTLWVIFRDGTPWEYYDVPPRVWRNFRRVKSPGRFINRVLNNYDYGRGDF
jgi:hypothetical protein